MSEYTTISVPNDLIERIDKIIKEGAWGYKTPTEFIKDAIRIHLRELEREAEQEKVITKKFGR